MVPIKPCDSPIDINCLTIVNMINDIEITFLCKKLKAPNILDNFVAQNLCRICKIHSFTVSNYPTITNILLQKFVKAHFKYISHFLIYIN